MKPKTRKVHQHAKRAESTDLQNELQKLTTTMQRLESKIGGNSCSFQQLNDKVYQLENMSKPQMLLLMHQAKVNQKVEVSVVLVETIV